MEQTLYVPKTLVNLKPLVVMPNGVPDRVRCRPIDADQWTEKPVTVLAYYREATEAELAELLPQV